MGGGAVAAAPAAARPGQVAAWWHWLIAALQSERTAWAMQNAVGTIFTGKQAGACRSTRALVFCCRHSAATALPLCQGACPRPCRSSVCDHT